MTTNRQHSWGKSMEVNIKEARGKFSSLIHQVEEGMEVILTRRKIEGGLLNQKVRKIIDTTYSFHHLYFEAFRFF